MRIELEKVGSLLADGLDELLVENWNEIETHRDEIPYVPDWQKIQAGERQGSFKTISVRRGSRIVGYNAFHVFHNLHSMPTKQAVNDVLWLHPDARGWGAHLVWATERILRAMGVRVIFYTTKVHFPLTGALLAKLEYEHVENVFMKVLT